MASCYKWMKHMSTLYVICGFLALSAQAQQTFDIRPSDTTTFVGATATLQCASSDKTGLLMWIKNGRMVSQDTVVSLNQDRYSITGDQSAGEYFLTITNVEVGDAGDFFCILGQGGGNPATASPAATLTVELTAPQQSFRTEPSGASVTEGEEVTLGCSVDNKAGALSWLKGGVGQISSETLINDPTLATRYSIVGDQNNGEYNLRITSAESSDAGFYTCYVGSQGGVTAISSAQAQLSVLQAVTTRPLTTKRTTTVPTRAPTQPLTKKTTSSITTKRAATTGQLEVTFPRSTPKDVEKETTTGAREITPDGLEAPEDPLCEISSPTLSLGDSVVLSCVSRGGKPAADLQLSRDDVSVEPSYSNTDDGRRIHLSVVLSADLQGALYKCTATHPSYQQAKFCHFPPLNFQMDQLTVRIKPESLIVAAEEVGSFECEATTDYTIQEYVWYFDGQEIDPADDRFELKDNKTILYLPNVTKAMDESVVRCEVTAFNVTESATATIHIDAETNAGLSSVSLVIVIAIVIVVLLVIVIALVLFYCLWWKKRQEKDPQPDEPIIEEDTAEVAQTAVGGGNIDMAPMQNGTQQQAYHLEYEIPYGKGNLLPPVRSHTPVGARPATADIEKRRDQPVLSSSRRKRKHKKKKRHNLIGPQESHEVNARRYGDKPRVLDHFVVGSVDDVRDNRHEEKERSGSEGAIEKYHEYEEPSKVKNNANLTDSHVTPVPLPSKSPTRSRREFDRTQDEDGERPRSPTPESYRPGKSSEQRYRRRRSVDEELNDNRDKSSPEHRRHRSSSERRHRDSSERRHRHRRSRDDPEASERRERRSRRPKSSRHRDRLSASAPAGPDYSEDSDVGLTNPKHLPPINNSLERHQLEMRLRKTDESDAHTTEYDDDREARKSRRRHRKSRERHSRRSHSRDRERSPKDE